MQSSCAFFVYCRHCRLGRETNTRMPIFRVTVKTGKVTISQRIDVGLFVDIQTCHFSNPIISDKDIVQTAFLNQRCVDLESMGALSPLYLDAKRIG